MRPQPVLLALVALFATNVIAQNQNTDDNDAATSSDAQTTPAPSTNTGTEASSTATPTSDPTSDPPSSASETSVASTATTTTPTPTDSVPPITTSNVSDEPLPTLPGQYTYPAPAVPPTQNAPFMRPSSMPEGTVFIAVGAILGAFGAAVLIWRAVVACLLHRSVKKAALAQQTANDKAPFPPPPAPFYKYSDQASSGSLGNAVSGSRGVRRTTRGPIPSATPSQTNLFFSPTAATTSNGGGNRESRFLPSGFYAAGAGSPQQSHGHSISLTNLRPESRGHSRALGHTPPESPSLQPRTDISRRNLSTSTLNLNRPPSGRAPSAFLEDLLDDPSNPFPPPSHHHTWSQSPPQTRH
ncbi:hypothetical protein GGR54DRAFT_46123 [Hypoxylon sp. NC1633]|nr:hypothetical protein GGR54DRAFT_46123 [Hypoxylon sp. NC1633]